MKGIDDIYDKALELKKSGMNNKEIARELHLSENTIAWLMSRGVESKVPPMDVKIGWKSAGVFSHRISYLSNILSDIILEEAEIHEFEPGTVVGIAINGIPLATHISDELGLEFSVYRPPQNNEGQGALSSNFASVKDKSVILVDDVIGTGETMSNTIKEMERMGAHPKLVVTIVNKTDVKEMDGVPVRAIVRARTFG